MTLKCNLKIGHNLKITYNFFFLKSFNKRFFLCCERLTYVTLVTNNIVMCVFDL
jgi:hypothetical protein